MTESRDGRQRLFLDADDRDETTFLRLCDRLPLAEPSHTDGSEVYHGLLGNQHARGKLGKTNRNEGIHSVLRDRLNRLHRKTKGYSKSLWWLKASVAMVCLYRGWI